MLQKLKLLFILLILLLPFSLFSQTSYYRIDVAYFSSVLMDEWFDLYDAEDFLNEPYFYVALSENGTGEFGLAGEFIQEVMWELGADPGWYILSNPANDQYNGFWMIRGLQDRSRPVVVVYTEGYGYEFDVGGYIGEGDYYETYIGISVPIRLADFNQFKSWF